MAEEKTGCPCGSGLSYRKCCRRFHKGANPQTALELMRSRYSAYALQQADYIVETTHPDNEQWRAERQAWIADILIFCQGSDFNKLEVLTFEDGETEAYVTFVAHLSQGDQVNSFRERSRFLKSSGRWLYVDGEMNPC